MEVVASLSQGRTSAAQCGLFTHKSVPVIFEPPCMPRDIDELGLPTELPSFFQPAIEAAVLFAVFVTCCPQLPGTGTSPENVCPP